MAEQTPDMAAQLAALQSTIAQLQQQSHQAPVAVQTAQPPMAGGFGLPQAQPQFGMGMAQQQFGGAPQPMAGGFVPRGVSIPVTIPLPDGREVSARLEFGPEAAQNLTAVAIFCAQAFGQYLQARSPRQFNGGGYGGNGGNGYGGNGGGYNRGYGRRY